MSRHSFYLEIFKSGFHSHSFQLLLDLGASPNYRDAKGLTPVHYSVIHGGDPACLSILVKDRSELDVPDDKGWRELHQVKLNQDRK